MCVWFSVLICALLCSQALREALSTCSSSSKNHLFQPDRLSYFVWSEPKSVSISTGSPKKAIAESAMVLVRKMI